MVVLLVEGVRVDFYVHCPQNRKMRALLLIVWNDHATEQGKKGQIESGGRKNVEHGGEISYHAQCV